MPSITTSAAPSAPRNPLIVGALYGLGSSLGYTTTNIFLRLVDQLDPCLVSCVKTIPVLAMCAGLAVHERRTGQSLRVSGRLWAMLIVTGVVVQIGGNVGFQWALRHVGLAITVSLCFGGIIVCGALLGRIWLAEPITPRSVVAMLVILIAIAVLCLGASAGRASTAKVPTHVPWIAMGALAACVSGAAFSISGIVIRHAATRKASLAVTLGSYSLTGLVVLGLLSLITAGPQAIAATSSRDLGVMLLAGVFNALAFYALGKSLTLVPVVHANTMNASQTALSAMAGVLLFHERPSIALAVGCGLTIAGLLLIERPDPSREAQWPAEWPIVPDSDQPLPAAVSSEIIASAAVPVRPAVDA